jgi:hypothetical protein
MDILERFKHFTGKRQIGVAHPPQDKTLCGKTYLLVVRRHFFVLLCDELLAVS